MEPTQLQPDSIIAVFLPFYHFNTLSNFTASKQPLKRNEITNSLRIFTLILFMTRSPTTVFPSVTVALIVRSRVYSDYRLHLKSVLGSF